MIIDAELKFGTHLGRHTFASQARTKINEIAIAAESDDIRKINAARASFGGLIKRWHNFLITVITEYALANHETSRWRVQCWQQQVFGKSVATKELHVYADPLRGAGDRAAPIVLTPEMQSRVEFLYGRYKNALRDLVTQPSSQPMQRKKLTAAEARMKAVESKLI